MPDMSALLVKQGRSWRAGNASLGQAGRQGACRAGTHLQAGTICCPARTPLLTSLTRASTASAARSPSLSPASSARAFTSRSAATRSQPLAPCRQISVARE